MRCMRESGGASASAKPFPLWLDECGFGRKVSSYETIDVGGIDKDGNNKSSLEVFEP